MPPCCAPLMLGRQCHFSGTAPLFLTKPVSDGLTAAVRISQDAAFCHLFVFVRFPGSMWLSVLSVLDWRELADSFGSSSVISWSQNELLPKLEHFCLLCWDDQLPWGCRELCWIYHNALHPIIPHHTTQGDLQIKFNFYQNVLFTEIEK